jgi:hypothetical protein
VLCSDRINRCIEYEEHKIQTFHVVKRKEKEEKETKVKKRRQQFT